MVLVEQQIKRFPAVKVSIKDIKSAKIVNENNNFSLVLNDTPLFRVNIIGSVVSLSEDGFLLDDSSGNVFVRYFDFVPKKKLVLGDLVLVVGKTRVFEREIYISCEVVRILDDVNWFKLRQEELKKNNGDFNEEKSSRVVYSKLKELDEGSGVDVGKLNGVLGYDAKFFIDELVKGGDVFEIKVGVFKVLE